MASLTQVWLKGVYYNYWHLYRIGNAKDFRSFMPEAGLKTKYIFLIINHSIILFCFFLLILGKTCIYISLFSTKFSQKRRAVITSEYPRCACEVLSSIETPRMRKLCMHLLLSLLLLFHLCCSVVFNSLWPCGLQHARLLCPSLSPGAFSNSCPLSWWCQSNHLILCCSLLLPSILSSIRVFSNFILLII